MTEHLRHAWAFGTIGAALALGFVVRLVLLGGVDGRGQLLAVAAATCLLLYAWLDRGNLGEGARERSVQLGSGAVVLLALAAVGAGAVYAVVRSADVVVSLGGRGAIVLSEHSRQVVAGLPRDVRVVGFFVHGSPAESAFRRLAERYEEAGPRLTVTLVDPLRQPAVARDYDVSAAGVVVVESGERREALGRRHDEVALTHAILRVSRDEDVRLCWSRGHGEADPDKDGDGEAMSALVLELEGQHYAVSEVSTLNGAVPEGCEVLVVARPRVDWLGFERDALVRYVAGGGRALVLLEPGTVPELARSLAALGVDVDDGVVLEPDPTRRLDAVDDASFMVLPREAWGAHPLSRSLPGAVTFGIARPVGAVDDAPGVAARALLHSSPSSWAEREPMSASPAPGDGERVGPVPLAAVSEVTEPSAIPRPEVEAADEEVGVRVLAAVAAVARAGADDLTPERTLADLGLDADGLAELRVALGLALGADVGVRAQHTLADVLRIAAEAQAARVERAGALDAEVGPGGGGAGRLLVIGDASFATNRYLALGANLDLALHAIAWLTGEEDLLAERPRTADEQLELSAGEGTLLAVLALFVAPALPLLLAVRARLRRRT